MEFISKKIILDIMQQETLSIEVVATTDTFIILIKISYQTVKN